MNVSSYNNYNNKNLKAVGITNFLYFRDRLG